MYIYTQNQLNIIGVDSTSKFSIDTSQQGLPRLVVFEDGVKNTLGVYLPNEAMTVLKQLLQALKDGKASFEMPISSRFSNGHPLTINDVERITAKLTITGHAKARMIERGLFSADMPPSKIKEAVILYIKNGTQILPLWQTMLLGLVILIVSIFMAHYYKVVKAVFLTRKRERLQGL